MHASQETATPQAGSIGPIATTLSIGTQAGLTVRLEPGPAGSATLVVTGRLDAAGGALVSAMLGHYGAHRARVRVCVDLSGVDSVDARGVRAVMAAHHAFRLRGGTVTLTGLGTPVAHAEASLLEARSPHPAIRPV